MTPSDPLPEPAGENGVPRTPSGDDAPHAQPTEFGPGRPADENVLDALPEVAPVPPRTVPQVRIPRPHPNFWWSLLWCIAFLFFTQVPPVAVAAVVVIGATLARRDLFPSDAGANPADLAKSPAFSLLLAVAVPVAQLFVIGVSWLVIRLAVGRDWTRRLALRAPGLAHLLLALAAFPALVLLANGSYEVIRKVLHVPSFSDLGLGGMEEVMQVVSGWPWPFAVLVIGLGPGIGEELWCRGFLGRGLVGRYGPVLGVVFTSFFFGLLHVDPAQGLAVMLMGLWLHFVYLTSRSLWLPMLLHFLNNALAVVASRIPALKDVDEAPGAIHLVVYAGAAVLLAVVGWALYQSRARLVAEDGSGPAPWRPAYPGVEYPPPGSGTRVAHPRPSWAAAGLVLGGLLAFVASCFLGVASR
jgi:membrane protease YdiL (CAAX protease family)